MNNSKPEKKIPMRMCLGCGEMQPKRTLIRIVRQKDGTILLDETGKAAGRGAYLCRRTECLKKAEKTHRLEKSFACHIDASVYTALEAALSAAEEKEMPDA